MVNLTSELGYADVTTVARVVEKMDADSASDSRSDFIASMIEEVGTAMMTFLGRHFLRTERTELYELRRFSKTIRLDGAYLASDPIVVVADLPANLPSGGTTLVSGQDFYCEPRGGVIRLFGEQPSAPLYVQVTYTGGYFENLSDIGMKHRWLTAACEQQVIYRLQRQDTLGGNVTGLGGAGTSYSGSYNWLPSVKQVLQAHRKGPI